MATEKPEYIIAERNENGEMVERPMTPEEVANYEEVSANVTQP